MRAVLEAVTMNHSIIPDSWSDVLDFATTFATFFTVAIIPIVLWGARRAKKWLRNILQEIKKEVLAELQPTGGKPLNQVTTLRDDILSMQERVRLLEHDGAARKLVEDEVQVFLRGIDEEIRSLKEMIEKKDSQTMAVIIALSSRPIILVHGDTGVIEAANREAEELFGWGPSELTNRHLDVLVPRRYRVDHAKYRSLYMKKPTARSMGLNRNFYAMKADGTEFKCHIGLLPFDDEEGFILAYITPLLFDPLRGTEEREARDIEDAGCDTDSILQEGDI